MEELQFRDAKASDVAELVKMLADDPLGSKREQYEDPLPEAYWQAFKAIDQDANHRLIVCEKEGAIAGFFQLSFLPNLSRMGAWRAQIEGVRVNPLFRRQGIGRAMFNYAIEVSRKWPCQLLQLTTDKTRPEAVIFYQSLGFVASHEGMKLKLH